MGEGLLDLRSQLGFYKFYHHNPKNVLIHSIFVPTILFSGSCMLHRVKIYQSISLTAVLSVLFSIFYCLLYLPTGLLAGALLLLSACGRSDVTSHSTGLWERLILIFGKAIQGLSFGGSIGLGIIIFTILIRAVMIPLYNRQIKSSRELQELQPELRRLQSEYPGRENREALAYAQQDLYKEHGVNPYASFVPLLIQFPILMALYGALTRVPELREGTFLWVDLGQKDPYFVLPILAAAFTFLSTWLTNKAAKDRSAMLLVMNIMLPIFIFWFGTQISSGVALYWAVSNAFQVVQILVFNNPFKIIEERNRLEAEEKERKAKIRRAKKKAHKRK